MVKFLLRNYFLRGIAWYKNYYKTKKRFPTAQMGYDSWCNNSELAEYVTLYENVRVSNSKVGKFTYFAEGARISNAQIGNFCSIGPQVLMGRGTHPTKKFVSTHPIFFSTGKQAQISFADKTYFDEIRPVIIGNDVWIGAKTYICDGVTIGNGAIIAAGAIVTKDVPPYAMVGGVPAKVLRYRFSMEEIDFLLKDAWWNKDINWLREHYKDFHNVKTYADMVKAIK